MSTIYLLPPLLLKKYPMKNIIKPTLQIRKASLTEFKKSCKATMWLRQDLNPGLSESSSLAFFCYAMSLCLIYFLSTYSIVVRRDSLLDITMIINGSCVFKSL